MSNLCMPAGDDRSGRARRMVDLLIDGLRYGADARATALPHAANGNRGNNLDEHS